MDWISVIFGAFGLGVLKLLYDGGVFLINRRDKKKTDDELFADRQKEIETLFNDLISSAVAIQEHLEEFILDINASRVSILKMENGGGVPQLGTVQHTTILNEAIHPKFKNTDSLIQSTKHDFQNHVVSPEYQKMMMDVINTKFYVKNTTDLDDGLLKMIFDSSGIKKFIILPITYVPAIGNKPSKGFLIYMSVQFDSDKTIDSKIESECIILKEKVRQIFHEFYVRRISIF